MIFEYFQKYQKERNLFLPLSEIKKRAGGKVDQYTSIFGYEEVDVSHGNIFGPMYFDIDNAEIKKAYTDTQSLLATLRFYSLTDQDFQVCFSGSKGFHITIFPQTMGVKPRRDLDKIYKQIASWFNVQLPNRSIDFKVYERRRLWRIINTINSKSSLFKIQIIGNETLEEILEKAKQPQTIIQKSPTLNITASQWIARANDEIKKQDEEKIRTRQFKPSSSFQYDDPVNPQIRLLIENGVVSGSRNNTAFYIACYLKSKDFSETEVEEYIQKFANNCNPPMDYSEAIAVIKSAYRSQL